MKRWIEGTKTVLLNVLVLVSFILTYMLWNNQPQFELISPPTYVKSTSIGQSKQLEDLIRPESIVFHYGENWHTKAMPNDGPYTLVNGEMSKWSFFDFTNSQLTEEEWQSLIEEKQGIEIRYRSGIPVSIISQLFTFRSQVYNSVAAIDRLWLYYEESDDLVYALFISSQEQQLFRARTSVDPKDLRNSYLPVGKRLKEQYLKVMELAEGETARDPVLNYWSIYYLPKESLEMRKYRYNYLPITEKAVTDTFFIDPGLVRRIVERDQTVIFTDGSRSVLLRPEQQTITFTDPGLPAQQVEQTAEEMLRNAVAFINKHLGWVDTFYFDQMENRQDNSVGIKFRKHLGSYPLVGNNGQDTETITVSVENGQIVSLKQSLVDLDIYIDYETWPIMSGPELFQQLRHEGISLYNIRDAFLAYETKLYPNHVELSPVWVLEQRDGNRIVRTARSQPAEEVQDGLE